MSFDNLKNRMPDYAKDIKLNLSSLTNEDTLNAQQFWGTALASAMATNNTFVINEVAMQAAQNMDAGAMNAAKAAAGIMAMNNIYYRFVHLASNKEYQTMQAKLRMNIIANPGVDKQDFELWSLAVSAINGCGMCIDAHEAELVKNGMGKPEIQAAVRIASVIHAAANVITAEDALEPSMAAAA